MRAKRVGVLMGGWGEERDISLKTGEAAAAALERGGHCVTRIVAGPGLDRSLRESSIEVAFIALHGRMGEDGKVQALLEVLELPYTGSGVLASALAMNKPVAKKLFTLHNLPTPKGYSVRREQLGSDHERHGDLGYPCVVKPSCGGSSVGVALVRSEEELGPALADACRFGGEALVERWIEGREITVGIVGDEVLGSCEIAHAGGCFSYASKYRGGSRYHLPPRLSPTRIANIEGLALSAYRALGCRGYGRVDLIASEVDNDVLLELNTLPGLTPTSLLPKIALAAGRSFEALTGQLLALATLDEVREPRASGSGGVARARKGLTGMVSTPNVRAHRGHG